MRKEDLLEIIGEVEDDLLERSEKAVCPKKHEWKRWISLAACACLILVVGISAINRGTLKLAGDAESDKATDTTAPEAPEAFADADSEADSVVEMEGTEQESVPEEAEPDYGINPLQGANPSGSALALYKYDGKETTAFYMYDTEQEQNILDLVAGLEYEAMGPLYQPEITYPIYGIEIVSKSGWPVEIAWSNGYWFTGDGSVLKADFNLGNLETEYEWRDSNQFDTMVVLPCARYVCQIEDGWRAELMTPSGDLNGQENVTMTVVKQNETALNVQIENDSKTSWEYGVDYSIEVLVDGIWYDVPTLPGSWAFTTELLILPEGESVEMSYGLDMYGQLPMGTYRVVSSGIAAEFEIE